MREKNKVRALIEVEWKSLAVTSKKEFEANLKNWVIVWLNPTKVEIKESEVNEVEG